VSFFHSPGWSLRESSPQTHNPAFDLTKENPVDKARRERRRALILPREHGAWGLLLVPMITGAGVALHQASHIFPLILLLTAALALFWLRTPLESLLGTSAMRAQTLEESHTLRSIIVLLASIAAVTLAGLLWAGRNAGLWPLGAAVAAAFIAQAVLKKLGRRTRMLSEMVGTIGLTASAPAAYYVITGEFNATAWMLWLANILFAGDQIHYVQLRIHTAKIQGFRAKFSQWLGIRAGAGAHDRDNYSRLPGAPDARYRVISIRPASVPRMVLLCSGADSTSRAPSRLERTEARHPILRTSDCDLHSGKAAIGQPHQHLPWLSRLRCACKKCVELALSFSRAFHKCEVPAALQRDQPSVWNCLRDMLGRCSRNELVIAGEN
jgi:hypothetical protein